jgi:hypothetical protein
MDRIDRIGQLQISNLKSQILPILFIHVNSSSRVTARLLTLLSSGNSPRGARTQPTADGVGRARLRKTAALAHTIRAPSVFER